MYKKYLLKCSTKNNYKDWWEDKEFYFDTIDEMQNFIKNGTNYIKPEDIKVKAAFELNRINIKF